MKTTKQTFEILVDLTTMQKEASQLKDSIPKVTAHKERKERVKKKSQN